MELGNVLYKGGKKYYDIKIKEWLFWYIFKGDLKLIRCKNLNLMNKIIPQSSCPRQVNNDILWMCFLFC